MAHAEAFAVQAPPMGFSAPSAFSDCRIGMLSGFQPGRLPPSAFRRPLRVYSSTILAALLHAADALGVLFPFRAFPLRTALPGSSPSDTLSTFLRLDVWSSIGIRSSNQPRPQGVLPSGSPFLDTHMLQRVGGRCSREVLVVSTAFVITGLAMLVTPTSDPFGFDTVRFVVSAIHGIRS